MNSSRMNFDSILELAKINLPKFVEFQPTLESLGLSDAQLHEIYLAAVKANPGAIDNVPREMRTKSLWIAAVTANGFEFSKLRELTEQTELTQADYKDIQLAAIMKHGRYALLSIEPEMWKYELCVAAVNKDVTSLAAIATNLDLTPLKPDAYQKFCLMAMDKYGIKETFQYLPLEMRTYDVCLMAANDDVDVLKYLKTTNERKSLTSEEYSNLCLMIIKKKYLELINPTLAKSYTGEIDKSLTDDILRNFIDHYESINKHNNYNMGDIGSFFLDNVSEISNIYSLLGKYTFLLLEKMLVTSADNLKRYLSELRGINRRLFSSGSKNILRLFDNVDFENASTKASQLKLYLSLSSEEKNKINILLADSTVNIETIPKVMREFLIKRFYDEFSKRILREILSHQGKEDKTWLISTINLSYYQQQQDKVAIPETEFDVLLAAFKNRIMFGPAEYGTLTIILITLFAITDMLIERSKNSERYFTAIDLIIPDLPKELFEYAVLLNGSKTAAYIRSKSTFLKEQESYKKEELIFLLKENKEFFEKIIRKELVSPRFAHHYRLVDYRKSIDQAIKMLEIESESELDKHELRQLLFEIFSIFCSMEYDRFYKSDSSSQIVTQLDFKKLISYLISLSSDKKISASGLLKSYHDCAKQFGAEDKKKGIPGKLEREAKSKLVKNIPILFYMLLEKLGSYDVLVKCMNETGFSIDNKCLDLEYKKYQFYLTCIYMNTKESNDSNDFLYEIIQKGLLLMKADLLFYEPPKIFLCAQKGYHLQYHHLNDKLSNYKNLRQLKPWLQDLMMNIGGLTMPLATMDLFIAKFNSVNEKATTHQKRDIDTFFLTHYSVISQFVEIGGENSIIYLKNHLAMTTLHLERMLLSVPVLPDDLKKSVKSFIEPWKNDINQYDNIKKVIILSSCAVGDSHIKDTSQKVKVLDVLKEAKEQLKTPHELVGILALIALKILFRDSVDLTPKDIDKLTASFEKNPEKMASLIKTSYSMLSSKYDEIYLNLLKIDLLGGDAQHFLHDTNDQNSAGKQIALHNKNIHTQLLELGISPDMALRYPKKMHIIINTNDDTNVEDETVVYGLLWGYLVQLNEKINQLQQYPLNNQTKKLIETIKEIIDVLYKEVGEVKDNHEIAKILKKHHHQLGRVRASIQKINLTANTDVDPNIIRGFDEFAEHVIQSIKCTSQPNIMKDMKTPAKDKVYMVVEQWKKENVETFFLGDNVGCCLATSAAQFSAMVQRRMDDAMLFHVALIDGKPAALIWVYVAKNKDNKIVLIANFFEVAAKYGVTRSLRLNILNGLLLFTQMYCRDNPNIHGFYMNQLEYGFNKGDLTGYEIISLNLTDKVGGAFIPGRTYDYSDYSDSDSDSDLDSDDAAKKAKTDKYYYLASLSKSKFHQFDELVLLKNLTPDLIQVDIKVESTIIEALNNKNDNQAIIELVAKEHNTLLAPFYTGNLLDNEKYKQDIQEMIVDVRAKQKDYAACSAATVSVFAVSKRRPDDSKRTSNTRDLSPKR